MQPEKLETATSFPHTHLLIILGWRIAMKSPIKYIGSTQTKDIRFHRFNRLTAIKFIENRGKSRSSYWLFRCDCGVEKILRASAVRCGNTTSCGCYRRNDISGRKFGSLTAIEFSHIKNKSTFWVFRCDCGNTTIKNSGSVVFGLTKSCGCIDIKRNHGMRGTGCYNTWVAMRNRCLSIKNKDYSNYGGRGINICDRWLSFKNFYNDMGDRPYNKTLERINNEGNYNKKNCKWATTKEQSRNRRNNIYVEYLGETKCISDWAAMYNINKSTLRYRLLKGMSFYDAVTVKVKNNK